MYGGLVTRKLPVCPSVCLSDKRVDCDKTEEKSVQIYIYIFIHRQVAQNKKNKIQKIKNTTVT